MNGTNNAKKWDGSLLNTDNTDGHRTAGDLVADLGAPFAELNTGTSLDASSWYQYKIAYYDGSTYKYSSAKSNPILTGATVHNVTLTDIPLGPSGTTYRYLYRTVGLATRANVVASTAYYCIGTISNNTTLTINDSMADATALLDQAPTWATVSAGTDVTPPKAKYSLINKERLFIANDPSGTSYGKSTVYWSKALLPEYFDFNTDYELIRPDDGDEINFIKNLYGIITVGKTRTISKLYTDITTSGTTTTFSVTPSDPFSFIGCISPFSAANSILGILYLGRNGLYNFNGQNSLLISDVITDKIKDILETSFDDVIGFFNKNAYIFSYTSSASGASTNDKTIVFDITRDSYVEDSEGFDSFTSFDSGDDSGLLYSGSSESDGSVWAQGDSFSILNYRYKSQLEDGTYDSIYVGGDESDPWMILGNPLSWNDEGTETWAGSGDKTWMIEDLTGEWWSPIFQINAVQLDKLYWNESLGQYGNVTFAIRTGATSAAVSAAAWSSEFTLPSGSDISTLTANTYIQLRASLSSTVYTEGPMIFLEDSFAIKLTYKKSGTNAETSYLSLWQGGMTKMGNDYPKRIKEIQVFYEGTAGTMTFSFDNSEGVSRSFTIDLSILPSDSSTDSYFGTNENKIFTYIVPFNVTSTGRQFQYKISEEGTDNWKVHRVVVRYDTNPYVTFGGG